MVYCWLHNTRTRWNNDHICLQELNSVTVKTSQSGYNSQDLLSYPDDFSTVTETTSESYSLLSTSSADYSFDTSSISSYKASSVTKSLSFATDEKISSESWNLLTSENFPVYSIFSILLFFLLLFIIIVRRKCSLQKKSKSKDKIQIKNDLHNYKRPHWKISQFQTQIFYCSHPTWKPGKLLNKTTVHNYLLTQYLTGR